jgi:hypothetical protein
MLSGFSKSARISHANQRLWFPGPTDWTNISLNASICGNGPILLIYNQKLLVWTSRILSKNKRIPTEEQVRCEDRDPPLNPISYIILYKTL